nr:MAG TPA: hypothetical protein [Caudoviricetes sp.]
MTSVSLTRSQKKLLRPTSYTISLVDPILLAEPESSSSM